MSEPSPECGGTAPPISLSTESNSNRPAAAVDSPPALEDYQCPVCLDTFIDVVESDCHHKFCDYCLQQWFRTRRNRFCPVCRTDIVDIRRLDDFNATMEAHLSQLLTPEQLNERSQTRQNREETLRNPTSLVDEEDEVIRRMQEEFFPTMDGIVNDADVTWHFELDVEDAIWTQGLFTRTPTYAHGMHDHFPHASSSRDNSFGRSSSRQPSRTRIRTRHTQYIPRYPPPSFRPHPVYEFLSEDSDYDHPLQEMTRAERTFLEERARLNLRQGNSDNAQRAASAAPSFEDMHSLRETIRLAEASMATAPVEQNQSESRSSYRPHFRARSRGFTPNSEERPRALTTEQSSLLAEFHHRFAQTELAFEAVTTAQNRLDVQGASLRNIYDQCLRAGLLDAGNTGNFPAEDQGYEYSHPALAFPTYASYLQQTFHRGTPSFANARETSSPYYNSIWATYLTGPNSSYQSEPQTHHHGFSHPSGHQAQGNTWYQRCLNHQPTAFQPLPLPVPQRTNSSYSEYYHNHSQYPYRDSDATSYQNNNHSYYNGRAGFEHEYDNSNRDHNPRDNRCESETHHENHRGNSSTSTHQFRFNGDGESDGQVENARRTLESMTAAESGDSDTDAVPDESILEEFRQFELNRSNSRQQLDEAAPVGGTVDPGGDRNNNSMGVQGFQLGLHYH